MSERFSVLIVRPGRPRTELLICGLDEMMQEWDAEDREMRRDELRACFHNILDAEPRVIFADEVTTEKAVRADLVAELAARVDDGFKRAAEIRGDLDRRLRRTEGLILELVA